MDFVVVVFLFVCNVFLGVCAAGFFVVFGFLVVVVVVLALGVVEVFFLVCEKEVKAKKRQNTARRSLFIIW